ncbi:hypothetical protein [Actinomadura xylanilytica]|uniref:hypothetical protein n=1 Tax=Actinomadura xylanilytica TaxID=887459 RepID=UPI00255A966F|nr:hypothetical protein [Actinomadura xylanilytica]MDL4773381.1 hypothetical protein [Actinomadura xylanilytica]
MVDLDCQTLDVEWQLQRVRRELLHRQTKTEASDATLPLPGIRPNDLQLQQERQKAAREAAGGKWINRGLVITTHNGGPVDPRNFNRSFEVRCQRAGVRRVKIHDTPRTCATLLVALDVALGWPCASCGTRRSV